MTPEELAARHPLLYHVTTPGAWPLIERLGLLSASELLTAFECDAAAAAPLTTARRRTEVAISSPAHGQAILNDNIPLSERALAKCLDDGLAPSDWFAMLNARVFFFPDLKAITLLRAKANRDRPREVLAFDTLTLIEANVERAEICPINSGAAFPLAPAPRGLSTFTPLQDVDFSEWRKGGGARTRRDIKEVAILGSVPHIGRYLRSRELVAGAN
jgi:hypothetical protein